MVRMRAFSACRRDVTKFWEKGEIRYGPNSPYEPALFDHLVGRDLSGQQRLHHSLHAGRDTEALLGVLHQMMGRPLAHAEDPADGPVAFALRDESKALALPPAETANLERAGAEENPARMLVGDDRVGMDD